MKKEDINTIKQIEAIYKTFTKIGKKYGVKEENIDAFVLELLSVFGNHFKSKK